MKKKKTIRDMKFIVKEGKCESNVSNNENTSDGDDSYEHDDHDLRGFCF